MKSMQILIYGAGKNGKKLLDLILREELCDYEIVGFCDQAKTGKIEKYSIFTIDKYENYKGVIIIAIEKIEVAIEVCKKLELTGYNKILWFNGKRRSNKGDVLNQWCVSCEYWKDSILPQVEMHIIDSCNLNCRGCTHFSPIFSDELPDLRLRLKDVEILKRKVSHIVEFYILGGEPFLNPEIGDYAKEIRKLLPYTSIYIVTNGILIPKVSDEILRCIEENNICISISEYRPTQDLIERICSRLDKFGIFYEIRDAKFKEKFNLPLTLNKQSKYPQLCISNGCITIWNGKIARCPTLMYIEKFNEYFDVSLPNGGIMKLNECPSGNELLKLLCQEVPLCKHCVCNEIVWSRCGKIVKLEDFATDK